MLEVKNIHVSYGSIEAIKGLSFEVNKGEIVTLIGANGAGKTTTLHTLSGLLRPTKGSITYNGKDLVKTPAHKILPMGIAHVPEGRRIFQQMTVLENLEMGAYLLSNVSDISDDLELVFSSFPRLKERRKQIAGTLSGGEQQMLAMGRALMSRPELMLMDEPSMGLAPILVDEIFKIIERINTEQGVTILLVEQNANRALHIASRGYVLETGKIVLSGSSKDLLASDEVREAYLG